MTLSRCLVSVDVVRRGEMRVGNITAVVNGRAVKGAAVNVSRRQRGFLAMSPICINFHYFYSARQFLTPAGHSMKLT